MPPSSESSPPASCLQAPPAGGTLAAAPLAGKRTSVYAQTPIFYLFYFFLFARLRLRERDSLKADEVSVTLDDKVRNASVFIPAAVPKWKLQQKTTLMLNEAKRKVNEAPVGRSLCWSLQCERLATC